MNNAESAEKSSTKLFGTVLAEIDLATYSCSLLIFVACLCNEKTKKSVIAVQCASLPMGIGHRQHCADVNFVMVVAVSVLECLAQRAQ